MNNQIKSKHVLFKSRYITREYTPLRTNRLDSAAPNKQFKPRSLTNPMFPWNGKQLLVFFNMKNTFAMCSWRLSDWCSFHWKMSIQLTKKKRTIPLPSVESLMPVSQMWATNTPHHCLLSQFYSSLMHVSRELTNHLSPIVHMNIGRTLHSN